MIENFNEFCKFEMRENKHIKAATKQLLAQYPNAMDNIIDYRRRTVNKDYTEIFKAINNDDKETIKTLLETEFDLVNVAKSYGEFYSEKTYTKSNTPNPYKGRYANGYKNLDTKKLGDYDYEYTNKDADLYIKTKYDKNTKTKTEEIKFKKFKETTPPNVGTMFVDDALTKILPKFVEEYLISVVHGK